MPETIPHDKFGPQYIIKVYDAKSGMDGVLVIDNIALGPGKGGIRMTSNITDGEVYRLARTMTWKNALAGIPFGGAKSGIKLPEGTTREKKKELIQAFARAIKPFVPKYYIGGPDVNTGEQEMCWVVDATGNWHSVTGKPANLCMQAFGGKGEKCGIPHEFGSTGFGVAKAAKVAAELIGTPIKGATVAIHGFGNVGMFAYQFLTEMGARVVAIADRTGAMYAEKGFDSKKISALIKAKKSIKEYRDAKVISNDQFWGAPVDILIPASVTDVIHNGNKARIKAKIIVEGGNIPMREPIEKELWKKGIVIVPDFVANAGGVISSYAEYRGYNPKRMFELVEKKIVTATRMVLSRALKEKREPREVAMQLARGIVEKKMKTKK
ncbi:MAG: Glu/Leu/Phe/Val dehydrogenase [Candidatus Liptonbacteria bacterium]